MNLWEERNWKPMLLGETTKPFDSEEYIFELKFDGTRALIFVSPASFKIYNRRNLDITYLYPELEILRQYVKRNTIFDGEIIAMDNGLPSFRKLQERAHLKNKTKIKYQMEVNPVIFICYDLLYDNKNLIDLPLIKRKELLEKYEDNDYFLKSKYIENYGIKLFETIIEQELEGIVAKKKNSEYEIDKRSNSWLKIKNLKEETFFIGGYIEKEYSYVISLFLGEYINNKFVFVGKVTLGKKTTFYNEIKKEKTIKISPFTNYSNEDVNFIKPKLKCKIKYMERTKNNHLRQPFISND